jgi:hypothetical protein
MATVRSLIARVRDRLRDYGDGIVQLATALTDTTGTSVTVNTAEGLAPNYFLLVDDEVLEIVNLSGTTLTVIRGARGSTAATHLVDAIMRINVVCSSDTVLEALNLALDLSYPKLYKYVENETLAVVSEQYEYSIPAVDSVYVLDDLYRVEIENCLETGEFLTSRNWRPLGPHSFQVNADYPEGRSIRLIGKKRFSALTVAGNMDTSYPTDEAAIQYLVLYATGTLLMEHNAELAKRDSFQGVTDTFSATQPYVGLTVGKQLITQAEGLLLKAQMAPIFQYMSRWSQNLDVKV